MFRPLATAWPELIGQSCAQDFARRTRGLGLLENVPTTRFAWPGRPEPTERGYLTHPRSRMADQFLARTLYRQLALHRPSAKSSHTLESRRQYIPASSDYRHRRTYF